VVLPSVSRLQISALLGLVLNGTLFLKPPRTSPQKEISVFYRNNLELKRCTPIVAINCELLLSPSHDETVLYSQRVDLKVGFTSKALLQ